MVLPEQLFPRVFGDLAELVVDVGDDAALVGRGDDRREVERVTDLFQARQGVPGQLPLSRPAEPPQASQDEAGRQRQPDPDQYPYTLVGHAGMIQPT